jgi:hypothetical protein
MEKNTGKRREGNKVGKRVKGVEERGKGMKMLKE